MKTILIVEDDSTIRGGISEFLAESGYTVFAAESAEEGLEIYNKRTIHLMVLDVMLPNMSGIELLKLVRKNSQIPIIILTALTDEQTQIQLFDAYADDYLAKPFSLMILKKRIEALLRRHYIDQVYWQYNKAKVDFKGFTALYDNKTVNLTTKEFQLLEYLITNKGITVSRDQILDSLWHFDDEPYERVIDVYIKNLRQKLKLDCIKTVKGIGYKLEQK